VTIGQLWYTWADRGAEGINKLQILAASGRLDDRTHPVTQAVLSCCYRPAARGLAWLQQGRVRIAFHRSPTGLDGHGRPGNYFVHALVGDIEVLSPTILARLWNAPFWLTEIPGQVPDKLAPITSVDAIELAPATDVHDDLVLNVMAGYLSRVRSFRRCAIDDDPSVVATCAAKLTGLLPERYGTVSFCSDPGDGQVERYDMVPGKPPTGVFDALVPSMVPGDDRLAADALMAAVRDGDRSRDVVAAIADLSPELVDFVERLQIWCDITRTTDYQTGMSTAELAFIGTDDRLIEALLDGPGRSRLAASVAHGIGGATRLVAALSTKGMDHLANSVLDEFLRFDPPNATTRLRRLNSEATDLAMTIAVGLVEKWDHDDVAALKSGDRVTLLRLLDESPWSLPSSADAVFDDETASSLFASKRSTNELRTRAFCRRPEAIGTKVLAHALASDAPPITDLLRVVGPAGIDAIESGVATLRATEAMRVARIAWDSGSVPAQAWLMDAIRRRDVGDQIVEISAVITATTNRPDADPRWGDLLLDAFLTLCHSSDGQSGWPQRASSIVPALGRMRKPSIKVQRWHGFLEQVTQPRRWNTFDHPRVIVDCAHKQFGSDVPEEATNIMIQALAAQVERPGTWRAFLDLLAFQVFRDHDATLKRVVEVAIAPPGRRQGTLAAFTILWLRTTTSEGWAIDPRTAAEAFDYLEHLLTPDARYWLNPPPETDTRARKKWPTWPSRRNKSNRKGPR
jgi:hypothetical protein